MRMKIIPGDFKDQYMGAKREKRDGLKRVWDLPKKNISVC